MGFPVASAHLLLQSTLNNFEDSFPQMTGRVVYYVPKAGKANGVDRQ